jgi:hypothetical protein
MNTASGNGSGEVVLYEAPNGEIRLDVRLDRETVWLSQRQMAVLFKTSIDNIGLHLRNIFKHGELEEAATTEDYSAVQKEGRRGVRRTLKHYNLDAIISVGYRINSGEPRVSENAMVALALLVAESKPGQKDLMIRLILNLLSSERTVG